MTNSGQIRTDRHGYHVTAEGLWFWDVSFPDYPEKLNMSKDGIRIRKAYEPRARVAIGGDAKNTLCKQSFLDECDINQIMKRWQRNHDLTHVNAQTPLYGDFSNAEDYLSALERVRQADAAFQTLPARLRAHVDNDAGKFLDYALDPDLDQVEAEALGMTFAEPTPPPGEAENESPAGAPEPAGDSTPNS